MHHISTRSRVEGHLNGGPLRFPASRKTVLLATLLCTGACAAAGASRAPAPGGETTARPLEIYRELGFITGNAGFPAVGEVTMLAGPADSMFVLLVLSLPNSALRFQRDGAGFLAEYRVHFALLNPDSVPVRRFSATERVRVASFPETGRTDESIIFQQAVTAAPGRYIARVEAADVHSARGFRALDTITVPERARAGLSAPLLVHEAAGRTTRDSLPRMLVNPRRTLSYGGAPPKVYIESYHPTSAFSLHVIGAAGDTVWRDTAIPAVASPEIEFAVVDVPAEALPVGRFTIVADIGVDERAHAPLLMTISDQWLVDSMDEVLRLLRYIAHDEDIEPLRSGSPAEQRAAWDAFWKRRDPLPVTELNEYRDQFFHRVRYAAEAFREGTTTGWSTDRGQVYIVLGAPDQAIQRVIGTGDLTGQANAEEWIYVNAPGGRLSLVFQDRTGFGRFELLPTSAAAFRGIAQRLKSRYAG